MGEWQHPPHFTETARRFEEERRAAAIKVFMDLCFPRLRETARTCGYALATHGTMRRDCDLIACPWVDDAVDPEELVKRLAATMRDATGWGFGEAREDWAAKPHGRVALIFIASSSVNVDLSIMPRLAKAEPPPAPEPRPVAAP
jgi:hypothetical protein